MLFLSDFIWFDMLFCDHKVALITLSSFCVYKIAEIYANCLRIQKERIPLSLSLYAGCEKQKVLTIALIHHGAVDQCHVYVLIKFITLLKI